MKQKLDDENDVVTKGFFRKELKKEIQKERIVTKKLIEDALVKERKVTKFAIETAIHASEMRTDGRARGYRDEVLTKMDQVIGELAQMREDRIFEEYTVRKLLAKLENHEERISILEAH